MIKDGYYKGNISKAKEIKTDREKGEGNPYNWKNIETKSYKKCSLDASTTKQPKNGSKIVVCDQVNAHWFRNFKTVQEDVSLDYNTVPRKEYNVRGFR